MLGNTLVCGASGFIGRNILNRLCDMGVPNIRALSFSRELTAPPGVEVVRGDLRNPDFVKDIISGIDTLFQFAATTSGSKDIVNRPSLHVTDNAIMNSYLLREAADSGVKNFIFPSCTVMYQSAEEPLKESDFNPNVPLVDTYFGVGHTKLYIEKMCHFFSNTSDMKTIVLRHSNIYGPYDKFDLERSHFVGATITKVIEAAEGTSVEVWGDGKTERDLLYVDDFVDAAFASVNLPNQYNLFNVGFGTAYSVTDIVEKTIEISSKRLTIVYDRSKPSINTRFAINSDKFSQATGWKPKISIDVGLKKAFDWATRNRER